MTALVIQHDSVLHVYASFPRAMVNSQIESAAHAGACKGRLSTRLAYSRQDLWDAQEKDIGVVLKSAGKNSSTTIDNTSVCRIITTEVITVRLPLNAFIHEPREGRREKVSRLRQHFDYGIDCG